MCFWARHIFAVLNHVYNVHVTCACIMCKSLHPVVPSFTPLENMIHHPFGNFQGWQGPLLPSNLVNRKQKIPEKCENAFEYTLDYHTNHSRGFIPLLYFDLLWKSILYSETLLTIYPQLRINAFASRIIAVTTLERIVSAFMLCSYLEKALRSERQILKTALMLVFTKLCSIHTK